MSLNTRLPKNSAEQVTKQPASPSVSAQGRGSEEPNCDQVDRDHQNVHVSATGALCIQLVQHQPRPAAPTPSHSIRFTNRT